MTPRHALVMVLVGALLLMALQPAPAEAIEPTVAVAIAGVALAIVVLIAYLVIANVDESRRADATPPWVTPETAVLVAYVPPTAAGDVVPDSAP